MRRSSLTYFNGFIFSRIRTASASATFLSVEWTDIIKTDTYNAHSLSVYHLSDFHDHIPGFNEMREPMQFMNISSRSSGSTFDSTSKRSMAGIMFE